MERYPSHPSIRPCASKETAPETAIRHALGSCCGLGLVGGHPAVNESTFSVLCHGDVKGLGDGGESGALDNRLCLASPDAAGAGPPRCPIEEAEKWQSTVGAGIHGKGLWGFPTDAGSALWEECLVRFPLGPFRRTLPSSSSAAASWEGIGNCDQLGQDARKVGMQGLS